MRKLLAAIPNWAVMIMMMVFLCVVGYVALVLVWSSEEYKQLGIGRLKTSFVVAVEEGNMSDSAWIIKQRNALLESSQCFVLGEWEVEERDGHMRADVYPSWVICPRVWL